MWDVFFDDIGLDNNVELALANMDLNDLRFNNHDCSIVGPLVDSLIIWMESFHR